MPENMCHPLRTGLRTTHLKHSAPNSAPRTPPRTLRRSPVLTMLILIAPFSAELVSIVRVEAGSGLPLRSVPTAVRPR
jgi:hypothetical protein